MKILTIMYRLSVCLWTGGVALFTLVVTPIIFKSFGRDMAGDFVGAVFPAYFRWGLACGAIVLACVVLSRQRMFIVASALLLVMVALTSLQAFYLEPRAAELKKQIPSFETIPKEHPLRQEFSRLHGISMACNVTVLAGGVILVMLF